jgi:hypothetical protein
MNRYPPSLGRGNSSNPKLWQPILRIEFACSQWDGWTSSLRVFSIAPHFCTIWFAQSSPLLTYITEPNRGSALTSSHRFYFGELLKFQFSKLIIFIIIFIFCYVRIKMTHWEKIKLKKKKKKTLKGTSLYFLGQKLGIFAE